VEPTHRHRARLAVGVVLVAIAVTALTLVQQPGLSGTAVAQSNVVPAPVLDTPAADASRTAVFAGGCFWGVQGVFQHVKGVTAAESGYAGGDRATANYETVSGGDTGHAESVRISYDPSRVTYGQLLQIFFSVVADPTTLNRQGPDHGTQYRTDIFAQDDAQQRVAQAYIDQLDKAGVFPAPIVTAVSPKAEFFPAEQYHQDFLNSNPDYPYIAINDMPKVNALKAQFPQLYSDQPVLMLAGSQH
jgi:peptide-methionine (S)-S-oxide reductase